ncbi:MAG: hypothetical protein M3Y66_07895, partial [Actinomycetota bacterium]|nr:hypothetical protein [Actinomycetota bacterium]
MTLPTDAVLRWRPDSLSTTAAQLRWHVAVLEAQTEQVNAAQRSAADHWHGHAAEAAAHRLSKDVTTGDHLVATLESVRTRLEGVADVAVDPEEPP